VLDVFSIRAEERDVELRVADASDAVVSADFDRIEQVLGNLIDNAFRHTPAGGRIEVGVRPPRAGFVEFFVTDSGSGIATEELPQVFDRFYRSSGETSGTGAGLGLAISREIVRAHGGEIRAESSAVGGTTFSFTLPLARRLTPARKGGRSASATPPASGEMPATGGG
jgi:signal transduction histidine kinase